MSHLSDAPLRRIALLIVALLETGGASQGCLRR